jgi:hypothetical protein
LPRLLRDAADHSIAIRRRDKIHARLLDLEEE